MLYVLLLGVGLYTFTTHIARHIHRIREPSVCLLEYTHAVPITEKFPSDLFPKETCFACRSSSQGSEQKNFISLLLVLISTACSPSRGNWLILVRYHRAVKFKFIDYK